MNPRARRGRVFARLALLAALLLATVPTIGRLFATPPSHAGMPMGAMALSHGMAAMPDGRVHAASMGHAPVQPVHGHPRPHQHDADCAYCPLVATTLVAPLLTPTIAPAPAPATTTFRLPRTAIRFRRLGTLGSRGPPRDA